MMIWESSLYAPQKQLSPLSPAVPTTMQFQTIKHKNKLFRAFFSPFCNFLRIIIIIVIIIIILVFNSHAVL